MSHTTNFKMSTKRTATTVVDHVLDTINKRAKVEKRAIEKPDTTYESECETQEATMKISMTPQSDVSEDSEPIYKTTDFWIHSDVIHLALNLSIRKYESFLYIRRKNDRIGTQLGDESRKWSAFTYVRYPVDLIGDLLAAIKAIEDEIDRNSSGDKTCPSLNDTCTADDLKSDLFWTHPEVKKCGGLWIRLFLRQYTDKTKPMIRFFSRIDERYYKSYTGDTEDLWKGSSFSVGTETFQRLGHHLQNMHDAMEIP